MGEITLNGGQVAAYCRKMAMDGRSQRELELRVMYLEAVHLPVFEETAHDDRARIKQLFAGRT